MPFESSQTSHSAAQQRRLGGDVTQMDWGEGDPVLKHTNALTTQQLWSHASRQGRNIDESARQGKIQ